MEKAEASGKTVEDALSKALAQLGANRDEVEFVVLDEGKQGGLLSFGRGRDAVVRVERKGSGSSESRTREPGGRNRAGRGERSGRGRRDGGSPGRGGRSSTRAGFEQSGPELTESDFFGEGEAPTRQRAGRPRDGGGRGRDDRGGQRGSGDREDRGRGRGRGRSESRAPRRTDVVPDINCEEVDFAAGIVDDLLRILDIDAEISIREPVSPGDGLGMARAVLDISGEDLGFLIGRRGESLMSFQYIVNLVMTRQFPNQGSVTIDIEHYRHRREEKVTSLADRMAERVRETGMPITLEPMTPAERRLVHLSLADDPELDTSSIGEGEDRKVVISIAQE